ncbi:MAG: hypothetical protein V6Z82_02505 [Flavobacteriales bacterium]
MIKLDLYMVKLDLYIGILGSLIIEIDFDKAVTKPRFSEKRYNETFKDLSVKFAYHGSSIFTLLHGLNLNENGDTNRIDDNCSAAILLRAQLECLLMLHHIYLNTENDDEKELRYYAWIYSAMLDQKNISLLFEEGEKIKEKNEREICKFKDSIKKLDSFNKLSCKEQKRLLSNPRSFKSLKKKMEEAGFRLSFWSDKVYKTYLCDHAHSGLTSVATLKRHQNDKNVKRDIAMCSITLTCGLIQRIVDTFKLEAELEAELEAKIEKAELEAKIEKAIDIKSDIKEIADRLYNQ